MPGKRPFFAKPGKLTQVMPPSQTIDQALRRATRTDSEQRRAGSVRIRDTIAIVNAHYGHQSTDIA